MTEDLDLSYRAQLRGWGVYYIPSLLVPAELPPTYTAYKSQQYRWAKGTLQTARKLLPALWRSPQSLRRKVQATIHLTHYSLHLQMAILALKTLSNYTNLLADTPVDEAFQPKACSNDA